MSVETRSWQELCEAVTIETDSKQLMGLVAKLLEALENRRTQSVQAPFSEARGAEAISLFMSTDNGLI
jgi:hypothetical protein